MIWVPWTLLVVSLLFLGSLVFGRYRNRWVYVSRMKMLVEDYAAYEKLPDYYSMFWRFWIWDVRRFLR